MNNRYLIIACMATASMTAPVSTFATDYTAADCVREQPEGVLKSYIRSGEMITAYFGGTEKGEQTGMTMDVVFAPDGKTVWFYNLLASSQDCLSWVKGELEGETVTIRSRQVMSFMDYGSYYQAPLLVSLQEDTSAEENSFNRYVSTDDDIVFTYRDGVFSLAEGTVIGLERYSTDPVVIQLNMNGAWLGYADMASVYTPVEDESITYPGDESQMEVWSVLYTQQYEDYPTGGLVKVATEGNDLYIKGLFKLMPEATLKGTINGDKVVFPSAQYMGVGKIGSIKYHIYSYGAEEVDGGTETTVALKDNMTFDYNAAEKTLTFNDMAILNAGTTSLYYCDFVVNPKLAVYEERPAKPARPKVGDDYHAYTDEYTPGQITVFVPCTDVNGDFINPENLSFQFFVDDEMIEFNPDTYFCLSETMTEIPYGFTDGYHIDSPISGFWWVSFFNQSPATIGARSVYTSNGQTTMSDMTIYDVATGTQSVGVENVAADRQPSSVSYYNLQGIKVDASTPGVLVRRTTYTDGTTDVTKVFVR